MNTYREKSASNSVRTALCLLLVLTTSLLLRASDAMEKVPSSSSSFISSAKDDLMRFKEALRRDGIALHAGEDDEKDSDEEELNRCTSWSELKTKGEKNDQFSRRRGSAAFIVPNKGGKETLYVVGGTRRSDGNGNMWGTLLDGNAERGPALAKLPLEGANAFQWTDNVKASSYEGFEDDEDRRTRGIPSRMAFAHTFSFSGNGERAPFLFVFGGVATGEEDGDSSIDQDSEIRNDLLVLSIGTSSGKGSDPEFRWYFDPVENTDESGQTRPSGRVGSTLSSLYDGRVVLFGGSESLDEDEESESGSEVWMLIPVENFDASSPRWQWTIADIGKETHKKRIGHSSVVWHQPSRDIIVTFGGCGNLELSKDCRSDVRLISAAADATSSSVLQSALVDEFVGDAPSARGGHSSIVLSGGSRGDTMLIFGGCNDGTCFDDLYELHLSTLDASLGTKPTWRKVEIPSSFPQKPSRRFAAAALLWPQPEAYRPRVLVTGGCVDGDDEKCGSAGYLDTRALCMNLCLNGGKFDNGACKCWKGYEGDRCEIKQDQRPCPNDCSGQGDCLPKGECRCHPGYSGADCSTQCPGEPPCSGRGKCVGDTKCECFDSYFDETCSQVHCKDDCSGRGECDRLTGNCKCEPGWDGEGCERELVDECPNKCHQDEGKGICVAASDSVIESDPDSKASFSCKCADGWAGKDCSKDKRCPKNGPIDERHACNGHGRCEAEHCVCEDAWNGRHCNLLRCPKDCGGKERGTCDGSDGQCICKEGFFGKDCSSEFRCTGDCSGHGACVGVEKCECFDGYGGPSCAYNKCSSSGGEDRCSGHGTCDVDTGACTCDDGFGGSACDQMCPGRCRDADGEVRGECVTNEADLVTCECAPGFSGADCSIKDSCPSSEDDEACSGHGTCDLGRCRCHPGWDGDACDELYGCPNACSEPHGMCRFGKCFCNPGFGGDDCSKRAECASPACSGHGICSRGSCFCASDWSGDDCGTHTPASSGDDDACDCNGRGVCVRGKCVCVPGWGGDSCDEVVSPLADLLPRCDPKCSAHGKCDLGTCRCDSGWRGVNCDREVESTCPENCSGHGACKFDICWCVPGYSGDDCSAQANCGADESDEHSLQALLELKEHVRALASPKVISQHDTVTKKMDDGSKLSASATTVASKRSPLSATTHVIASIETDDGVVAHATASSVASPGVIASKASALAGGARSVPVMVSSDEAGAPVRYSSGCSGHGVCEQGKCFCHPAFHGDSCEKRHTCLNDCSKRGICVDGACLCVPGFGGKDCSHLTQGSEICPDDCSGHGRCDLGKCFCYEGWTGRGCDRVLEKACPNDCFQQGDCDRRTGTCFCNPGFSGDDCGSIDECPEGCEKHGVCKYGKCFCAPGWTGSSCSKSESAEASTTEGTGRPCPNMCSGRGLCHEGACYCEPGYGGISCNRVELGSEECPNDCTGRSVDRSGKPSPKRGLCVLGHCFCYPGFEGSDCGRKKEIPCPSGDCGAHGTCHLGRCFCESGWEGDACEKVVEERCPHNCFGHGICKNDKCICAPGFFGANCDQVGKEPCATPCEHGHCLFGQCICDKNWGGDDCSKNLILPPVKNEDAARFKQATVQIGAVEGGAPMNCSGNGIFVSETGKCFCYPGFVGDDCGASENCFAAGEAAEDDDDGCGAHGVCANGRCICDEGWKGRHCGDSVPTCPANCSGNGVCRNGRCWCDPSFVGPSCAESLCPNDCNSRGICSNGQCYCVDGFTGPSCVPLAQANLAESSVSSAVGRVHGADSESAVDGSEDNGSRGGTSVVGTFVVCAGLLGVLAAAAVYVGCRHRGKSRNDRTSISESELGETTTAAVPFLGHA